MPRNTRPRNSVPLPLAMQSASDYQFCAERLKALADPHRLKIVNLLLRGEMTVGELTKAMEMRITTVSHHLGLLRNARLVNTCRQGKYIIYSLPPDVAAATVGRTGTKTIDLGCCQLDILQPKAPKKNKSGHTRKNSVTKP